MSRRGAPKHLIYRDLCIALDILPLAKRGWLAPGWHEGEVESLSRPGACGLVIVAFQAHIGPNDGVLTLDWPVDQEVAVRRIDTRAGPRWLFACGGEDCGGRLTRRLLLPQTPPGITVPWMCRRCWRVVYRQPPAGPRVTFANLDRLQKDLNRMRRMHEFIVGFRRGVPPK
jgi:hypothetical protein